MAQQSTVILDLSNVPEPLLTTIFGNLDTKDKMAAAEVCKKWRSAVYDSCLWKHVTMTVPLLTAPPRHVLQSLQWRRIQHVEIVVCHDALILRDFLEAMPTIQSVTFDRCFYFLRDHYKAFDQDLPALTSFTMGTPLIDDRGVETLVRRAPNLKELTLTFGIHVSDVSMKAIGSHARHLEMLNVSGCPITNIGLKHLQGLALLELNVSGCLRLIPAPERLVILTDGFPSLKRLRVLGREATEPYVKMFLKKHPHLELLHFAECGCGFNAARVARAVKRMVQKMRPLLDVEISLGVDY